MLVTLNKVLSKYCNIYSIFSLWLDIFWYCPSSEIYWCWSLWTRRHQAIWGQKNIILVCGRSFVKDLSIRISGIKQYGQKNIMMVCGRSFVKDYRPLSIKCSNHHMIKMTNHRHQENFKSSHDQIIQRWLSTDLIASHVQIITWLSTDLRH